MAAEAARRGRARPKLIKLSMLWSGLLEQVEGFELPSAPETRCGASDGPALISFFLSSSLPSPLPFPFVILLMFPRIVSAFSEDKKVKGITRNME